MVVNRQERGVARLLRQQEALASFGSYAFREKVLLNILTEAARVCAEGLEVPFCKVCRYRAAENDLLVDAGVGWNAGVVGQVISQADESSPQGRAYVTGKPVIIGDLGESNHLRLPAFYAEHGIVSTVDVIIKGVDGEPYGVLEIDSPTKKIYDQHDVDFLTGFANVLAEAVATVQRNELLRQTMVQMKQLVAEKDKLLDERAMMAQELQHRVRNNLQLVNSMLASHLRHDYGIEERNSIDAIIRRVTTLAEVYEQLLGNGMSRTIEFGQYLRALCNSLPSLQRSEIGDIQLICDVQPVSLDLDSVTALGMVVAELVSNSYGHAFPDAAGTITVSLRYAAQTDHATLAVSDDGLGFVEPPGSKRHGLGLVRRLMEQVGGSVQVVAVAGTTWTLSFPVGVTAEPLAA
jgi:two-component sensor histidine kinase